MSNVTPDLSDITRRMDGAITALKGELAGLRTGRASANLVEPLTVEAYGSRMPINQVATISVPEPRMITIQVWDKSMIAAVDKAVRDAGLGLNPVIDGQNVRLPIPELNEERRKELAKIAAKYAEQARVAVRSVRRDGMDMLKKMEKDGDLSQDDQKSWEGKVQKLTDDHVAKVDEMISQKEQEIMQV